MLKFLGANVLKKMLLFELRHIFTISEQKWLGFMALMLLISSLLELSGLALVIPYVNIMMSEQFLARYSESWPLLNWVLSFSGNYRLDATILFASFFLFKNSLLGILAFNIHSIQKRLQANIEKRMFQVTLEQPYERFILKNSSNEIRKIIYDATNFGEAILSHSAIVLAEIFLFLGVVILLALHQVKALIIILPITLLLALIFIFLKRRLVAWGRVLQDREAIVIKNLQEGIGGFKDAHVLGVVNFFQKKFDKNVILRSRIKRNRDVAVLIPRFVIETLMMISIAITLLWLSHSGGLEKNFATIAFLAIVVVRMLPMSNRVMNSISVIRTQMPSIEMVCNILKENSSKVSKSVNIKSQTIDNFFSINIRNLSFGYNPDQVLLRNISLDINRGDFTAIVGASGAGKSTLADIILGLLRPHSGKVLINNESDIHVDLKNWQKRIGYVQQNVFLLDDTIINNIAFGVPENEINLTQVIRAAELAKLTDWIATLSKSFETQVGERGLSISGGQRQRIGIARAMYHDPEILILDESTSALDNRTEYKLMEDVYSMSSERTIILIAHRLSTIERCNKIILLDNGVVAGVDTYKNLQEKNKTFQKLLVQNK